MWRIAKHSFLYPAEKRSTADQELAREDFLKEAIVLEKQISTYLVGDTFSVADIVMAYTLNWANGYELLHDLPKLRDYLTKHKARESFPNELFSK